MERHFQVEVTNEDSRAVLRVHGELDVSSSAALEDELARVSGMARVVIDMRELEFIDSTGLGVLVRTHQQLREAGNQLVLVDAEGQVRRLLALTGLTDQLTIVQALDELSDPA